MSNRPEVRPGQIPEHQQKVLEAKREQIKAQVGVENITASVAALQEQGARPERIALEQDRLAFFEAAKARFDEKVARCEEVCAQKDAELTAAHQAELDAIG